MAIPNTTRWPADMVGRKDTKVQFSPSRFPSYRTCTCRWCDASAVICRRCDRRQRYCPSGPCAAEARAESCRRYRSDFQRTPEGRADHADAQARWRERRELAVLEVALASPPPSVSVLTPEWVGRQPVSTTTADLLAETPIATPTRTPEQPGAPAAATEPDVSVSCSCTEVGMQIVMDHPSTVPVSSWNLSASEAKEEPDDDTLHRWRQLEGMEVCAICRQPCGPLIHFVDDW